MTTLAPDPRVEAAPRDQQTPPRAKRPALRRYRPELDGLRTVAVYAVVLYHAHVGLFHHGGVGVDVFFVLSGFLITQLLLVEVRATGGVNLPEFLARRMRRLLPASWAALVLGAVALRAFMAPDRLSELEGTLRAALLWFGNWHFLDIGTDHFRPFLHYWSLSLEEQFYLAWPLLVLGAAVLALRTGGKVEQTVLFLALAGATLSLMRASALFDIGNASGYRAYFGTDTRAYQLLAGAALAAWFRDRGVPSSPTARATGGLLQLVGLVAVVVLTTPWLPLSLGTRGLVVTLATVAVLGGMEVNRRGPAARWLGSPRMAQLGRVSYGTYLWHWVVVVLLIRNVEWNPWAVALVGGTAATALAALSAAVLERPIRSSRWLAARPGATIVLGIGISVALAVTVPGLVTEITPVISVD